MKQTIDLKLLARRLSYITGAVIVLLPFHALLTTWLGSNVGHLDAFRIWKELIILAVTLPTAFIALRTAQVRRWLSRDALPLAIFAYLILYILAGLVALRAGRVNGPALVYALLVNLRFLGFFLITTVLAVPSNWLEKHWRSLVLIPAALVVVFGCLQAFVLPYDFLRHAGYGPKTIPAFQTVDNKIDYRRIQSTLRGANPLGAYLVVVIGAVLMWWPRRRWQQASLALLTLIALMYSYSRSAWLGSIVTVGVLFYWAVTRTRRHGFLLAGLCLVVIATATVVSLRRNHVLQNTVFHTDNSSHAQESSNASRTRALRAGWHDVVHEPLGRGPGTAGPESVRNNHPARIAENYFLQIGQEVGWLGIALFAAINGLLARELWRRRRDPLARALLASLAGLTIVNMLSHAWADDTLGLLWWGLAGIALAPAILKRKKHEPQEKTATRD